MENFKLIPGGICAPAGFSAAGVHCGIRHNHSKLDLALIKADVRCAGAGCYTTNKVYGAPITVDREHLKDGYAQAIVVNSGNANTCAPNGIELAKETCEIVAKELGISADDVLPSSTGVIGQAMSIEPFAKGIPEAAAKLAATEAGSHDAATAIMTTDTHSKEVSIEFTIGGKTCRMGAIAKGYASDAVAAIYQEHGITHGIVDLGGNTWVCGGNLEGEPWQIGIQDPARSAGALAGILEASDAFAVTSGGYQRYFEENGKTYHHIIDPATGHPAESGLTSVTVVADGAAGNGTMCDALSTALFVMGEDRALELWRSGVYDFDLILVTEDGRLLATAGIADRFRPDDSAGYAYEIVS